MQRPGPSDVASNVVKDTGDLTAAQRLRLVGYSGIRHAPACCAVCYSATVWESCVGRRGKDGGEMDQARCTWLCAYYEAKHRAPFNRRHLDSGVATRAADTGLATAKILVSDYATAAPSSHPS